jgi:hypothetical protein
MTRFVVGEDRNLNIGLFTQSGPEGDIADWMDAP